MENCMETPQKLNIDILYDSAIPLLGIESVSHVPIKASAQPCLLQHYTQ
jgi:hypothetical protein